MSETPQVGDWVRFYVGGRLVVGVVEYVTQDTVQPWKWWVATNVGSVCASSVLEIRRRAYTEPSPCCHDGSCDGHPEVTA
jgi:hypothetical protein